MVGARVFSHFGQQVCLTEATIKQAYWAGGAPASMTD
jgi:hypothetical protein